MINSRFKKRDERFQMRLVKGRTGIERPDTVFVFKQVLGWPVKNYREPVRKKALISCCRRRRSSIWATYERDRDISWSKATWSFRWNKSEGHRSRPNSPSGSSFTWHWLPIFGFELAIPKRGSERDSWLALSESKFLARKKVCWLECCYYSSIPPPLS